MTDGMMESQTNVVDFTEVISESQSNTVTRTIDRTTYVVGQQEPTTRNWERN